jgi:hypothetical protein
MNQEVKTKVCNRCEENKSVDKYWKDNRRKGTDSYYQQPCIDCRNEQKRIKRKLDFSNNLITDGKVSYHSIRRYCTGLDKKHLNKDFVEFVKQNIILKREIKNQNDLLVFEDSKLFCRKCLSIVFLPKKCSLIQLEKIINNFKEIHSKCYKKT